MVEKLDDILEGLLELSADRVTLEWVTDGLEVSMYIGSTGVGGVVKTPLAAAIIEEIVRRGNKGMLNAKINNNRMKFVVREYDHFGETAFEIRKRN